MQKTEPIRWRAGLFPWISLAYLALIYGLPTACAAAAWRATPWAAPAATWAAWKRD